MWRLQPPHKKRRLSHTVSLFLYNFFDDDDARDGEFAPLEEESEPGAQQQQQPEMDPDALLLPAPKIPSVATAEYDEYLQTLPPNIIFQARIAQSQLARAMYPGALVGETVRLYYPDHRSFNDLLHEGVLKRLGVETRDAVRTFKLVAKKSGEVVFASEFMCFEEQWEAALVELRKKGVGRRSEGGLRSADSVRLLVGLDCETY